MRVSSNMFSDRLVGNLGNLSARQMRLQTQAATGQRISAPEDDPAAMRRVLDLQEESGRVRQYGRNVSRLQEVASASHSTLRSLQSASKRAGEIAVSANGLRSGQELQILGREVTQLIENSVNAANATNRGDYILGGTRTDQPPYVINRAPDGAILSVTFQGNAETPEGEVAEGVTLSGHLAGTNAGGVGPNGIITDPRSGADFFNNLIQLQNQLLAADEASLADLTANTRPAIQRDEDNLTRHLAGNATLQARLELAASSVNDRKLTLEKQVSNEADADLAETMIRLNDTNTAYQAALQSGAQVMQLSLLDYIR
jgi:flagellar hook-associated protein 3 FlgL